ncbi:MAG: hypothetical protein ACI4QL_01080 [Candidatus Fimimonas sp.]
MVGFLCSARNAFTGNKERRERQLVSQQIQNDFTAEQNSLARGFNASEAQKLRDWQTEMSNTAYSRAIADLKKNGINPYMAISGMSAASTPSGASASSGAGRGSIGSSPNSPRGWSDLLHSAFSLANTTVNGTYLLASSLAKRL